MSLERAFQKSLAKALQRQGWLVKLEHAVSGGRIDILAWNEQETRIIETKIGVIGEKGVNEVSAQLLRYAACIPTASLWFAAPSTTPCAIRALKELDIYHLKTSGYRNASLC